MKETLNLGARLLIICIVAGLCLAGTYAFTKPEIERREKEALIRVYREFFPSVSEFNEVPLTDNENTPTVQTVTKMTAEDGSLLGYCLGCSAKGYKGAIALTVAFDAQGNLLGVRIREKPCL